MDTEPLATSHGALLFPSGFWWGATTAAYSVEGDNASADWWRWEQRPGHIADDAPSRHAARHFTHYADDFLRAQKFGHNATALSLEWSRIEPDDGVIDETALQHYREVAAAATAHGLSPMVTLVHYALPRWFAESGGWLRDGAIDRFTRYVGLMADALGDGVAVWLPIAHPSLWAWRSHVEGVWPPGLRNPLTARRVWKRLVEAHVAAYATLKGKRADALVALPVYAPTFVPHDAQRESDARLAKALNAAHNDAPRAALQRACDVIALTPGPTQPVRFAPARPRNAFAQWMPPADYADHGAFRALLARAKTWETPIVIHGDGLATADDNQRQRFLQERLRAVHEALAQGLNVRGYFVRALLDGYEWERGYSDRYGLFHVDWASGARTPNPSAFLFKDVCEANGLTSGALSRYGGAISTKVRR